MRRCPRPSTATATAPGRRRSGTTKHDLTAAAAALFGERGFAAVSVQEIADRVGISAAAIYRHYPSKEALLDAVLFEGISTCEAAVAIAPPAVHTDDLAAQAIRLSVKLVVDSPGQLATYARERHRAGPEAGRALATREAKLFDRWSDVFRAAQPALGGSDIVVRQLAVNGVLSALAQRPGELSRSRLRTLVTDGLASVVNAPPVTDDADVATAGMQWQPPESRREQILRVAMRLFAERGQTASG